MTSLLYGLSEVGFMMMVINKGIPYLYADFVEVQLELICSSLCLSQSLP